MPVPVCRSVQEAYEAGRQDALTCLPEVMPEVAVKVAEILAPLLLEVARARLPSLLTVPEAAGQLGLSARHVYELMYMGELASVDIPSSGATGRKTSRRIERAEILAFIERNRNTAGVPEFAR